MEKENQNCRERKMGWFGVVVIWGSADFAFCVYHPFSKLNYRYFLFIFCFVCIGAVVLLDKEFSSLE